LLNLEGTHTKQRIDEQRQSLTTVDVSIDEDLDVDIEEAKRRLDARQSE